jgi:hypothetical protein
VLLEGPAIEPLLAQVRDEYGSSVRIISADKVRTGGFGGFFAKQHYELSVEVPDPDERNEPQQQQRKPTGEGPPETLEQLLARAESRDRIARDEEPAAAERRAGRDAGFEDVRAGVARAGPGGAGPGGAGLSGAGLSGAGLGGAGSADPGSAFAEMLAGLDRADAPPRPAPRPPAAGAGRPDRPDSPTVRPFRPPQATGTPVNGGTDTGVRPGPTVPSLAELMGGLGVTEGPAFPASAAASRAAQSPAPPRTAAAAYGLAPTSPVPPGNTLAETLTPAGLSVPTGPGVTATTTAQPPAMLRPSPDDLVQHNLMTVGMPPMMAAQVVGGDTYPGVLSLLAARPAAPGVPNAPGEVLVLCGELDQAVPIGKQLCEQSGIDQAHLLLGAATASGTGLHSSRVLGEPAAAAAKAERLHNADHAWIVLVEAKVGHTDPIWINDMCEAVGATAVWAVVDATRKTADTARHLRTLGEVEALVVHSVEITADPATVLGLDLPIVSLDGKPATPHAWAAMLCARIAADIVPMPAAPRRSTRIR